MEQREQINRAVDRILLLRSLSERVQFEDDYDDPPPSVGTGRFDLPNGLGKVFARPLIDLGSTYPYYGPRDWYLSRGLRKNGRKSGHYFEDGFVSKPFCERGFAWYSLHFKSWRPNSNNMLDGDNLLTAVEAFYDALRTD